MLQLVDDDYHFVGISWRYDGAGYHQQYHMWVLKCFHPLKYDSFSSRFAS